MKKIIAAAVVLFAGTTAFGAPAAPAAAPDSLTEAAATLIVSNFQAGMSQMFGELHQMGVDVDSATVVNMVVARLGQPYSNEAHREAARTLSAAVERASVAREQAFLAAAAARPGARTLPGGLVIETLREGTGATPAATDTVTFHYTGKLADGTVFDDSTSGEPLTGPVAGLVAGMTQGLQQMKAGGKYVLTMPSELGYGQRGAGGVIPPNAPLEFTIELLGVTPAAAPAPAPAPAH